MFFERIGEVVVDDDFIVVQNDVSDKIFHESFSYAYILYVAAYRLVQELNDFCGGEFCKGALFCLFGFFCKLHSVRIIPVRLYSCLSENFLKPRKTFWESSAE